MAKDQTHGFYVDGVDIAAIALPTDWQTRLVVVDTPNTNGVRGLCLDPHDLAISKLAASRPKDLDYLRVLLREQLVSLPLQRLLPSVASLDDADKQRLRDLLTNL